MPKNTLEELFPPNTSPYFGMFRAGYQGYPIEAVAERLALIGIPVRDKDIRAWQDGAFKRQMLNQSSLDPIIKIEQEPVTISGVSIEQSSLEDFPMFPEDWVGTERRFFPCSSENVPLQKWGWSTDFTPQLYDYASAKALSPVGWVGQNMIYQRFIVIDIDGVGHGVVDYNTIAWGSKYKGETLCMEDPNKYGSFHLYFMTNRIIPIKHFPWAKIDFMGNAKNAAVYLKNKQSNNLPMTMLTNEIWKDLMDYQKMRKENQYES